MKKLNWWDRLLIFFGIKNPPVISAPKPVEQPPVIIPTPEVPKEEKPEQTINDRWKDRRFIGQVVIASAPDVDHHSPNATKENSWIKGDPKLKLSKASTIKEAMMLQAKFAVSKLLSMNAQGMIGWDLPHGQEFPHPHSYIGDPALVMNEEIHEACDDYFKYFRDHGLKVGVCIRASDSRFDWPRETGGWVRHYTPSDWLKCLTDKIDYAYKRWGCTLFYIDSNVGYNMQPGEDNTLGHINGILPASYMKQLYDRYPDCVFFPEHETPDYSNYTIPFQYAPTEGYTNDYAHAILVGENPDVNTLILAVENKNILIRLCTWEDPVLDTIKYAYETVTRRN